MASAWVEIRRTAKGEPRYRVRFRPGGRGPGKYGGSFKTHDLAYERIKAIRMDIASLGRRTKSSRSVQHQKVEDLYTSARRFSQQVSLARDTAGRGQGRHLAEAEELMGQVTGLLFEVWRKSHL